MRVAITGATGLIGSALVERLETEGHEVTQVTRRPTDRPGVVVWDPAAGRIDAARLEAHDAVVHLAGESLIGLWTREKKARIRESRVQGTSLLARTLAGLSEKPRVLVSGSALGYYGHCPFDEPVDETAPAGSGFLADTAVAWEAAAIPAAEAGIRVAYARTSLVLSRDGGLLRSVLPIFRLGLGGRLGNGRQPWSWIALEDEVGAILHMISHHELAGPVNLAAPGAVTNAGFTETLGRVLHRPAWFGVPGPVLRLAGSDFADEMMLGGARLVPRRLLDTGFRFRYPELQQALAAEIGR